MIAAALNIFRLEILLGLWLLRRIERMVPSWREGLQDSDTSFSWSSVGDRRQAYESMVPMSGFGTAVLSLVAALALMIPARVLGFPPALLYLAVWVPASAVLAPACAYIAIKWQLSRTGPNVQKDGPWETDIERNRMVMLWPSVIAIGAAAIVAGVVVAIVAWW